MERSYFLCLHTSVLLHFYDCVLNLKCGLFFVMPFIITYIVNTLIYSHCKKLKSRIWSNPSSPQPSPSALPGSVITYVCDLSVHISTFLYKVYAICVEKQMDVNYIHVNDRILFCGIFLNDNTLYAITVFCLLPPQCNLIFQLPHSF